MIVHLFRFGSAASALWFGYWFFYHEMVFWRKPLDQAISASPANLVMFSVSVILFLSMFSQSIRQHVESVRTLPFFTRQRAREILERAIEAEVKTKERKSEDYAIETFDITRRFDNLTAVDHVNFKVEKGELFGFLGPNGAGKTTIVNMLCCLLSPTGGSAEICGHNILTAPDKVRTLIGVSPQETTLYERLTGFENLELIGRCHGLSGSRIKERGTELLQMVGLDERANEQVKTYSGGMKRRVNLIMALIHDPEVVFLDEATLGLDPQARRAVWDIILGLTHKGKTVLLTTHYMEEADDLCDRVGIIDKGRIIALGTPQNLKAKFGEKTLEDVFIKLTGRTLRE